MGFCTVSDCESKPSDENRGRKRVGFHDQVEVLSNDPEQSLNNSAKRTMAETCFRQRKPRRLLSGDQEEGLVMLFGSQSLSGMKECSLLERSSYSDGSSVHVSANDSCRRREVDACP